MGPAALSPLPASDRYVRSGAGLFVHLTVPAAARAYARLMAAVVDHHGHESGDRDPHGHGNMVHGGACVSAGRTADHAAGGIDRRLAFLRPASVRRLALGP